MRLPLLRKFPVALNDVIAFVPARDLGSSRRLRRHQARMRGATKERAKKSFLGTDADGDGAAFLSNVMYSLPSPPFPPRKDPLLIVATVPLLPRP